MTNKPTTMLSDEQVFQLAKKHIGENDVKGFNDNFMFMTRQMRKMLQEALNHKESK